jgi:hypothetical protein
MMMHLSNYSGITSITKIILGSLLKILEFGSLDTRTDLM